MANEQERLPTAGSPGPDNSGAGDTAIADDNFTTEERQQFEDMQRADLPTADGGSIAPADGAPPAGAAPPVAAAGSDDDEEGDDEGDGGAPAAGAAAPGAKVDPNAPVVIPKRVAYGKFRRTEERAKKAETELAAANERNARFDERMKILSEALATPKHAAQDQQTEEDIEPDPEADVFNWIKWSQRENTRLREQIGGVQQSRQAEQADTSLSTAYIDDARSFATKEPNFIPAYQHLMASRTAEMALYWFGKDVTEEGVTLTPAEVNRIKAGVAEEEKQLAAAALKSGQSPAQRIFQLAKARGWRQPAAGEAAAPAAGAAPAGGAAPAAKPAAAAPGALQNGAAPANGKQPSVKDEIDRIKSGQEASMSLSQGGGAPNNPLTAQKLADMPQDEFNRLVDTLSPEEFQRLVEGTA